MMRLPGFVNHNGSPSKVYTVEADPSRRYDLAVLERHLPSLRSLKRPKAAQALLPSTDTSTSWPQRLADIAETTDAVARRALAYMQKFALPGEGQRNLSLFNLCANLVEKFDLPCDTLLELVVSFNAQFPVPLEDAEVEAVTRKAYRHIHKQDKPRGTWLVGPTPAEQYREPTDEVISLPAWREQMRQKRLASLKQPNVLHFDGSAPGSGKSTADLVAMKEAGAERHLPAYSPGLPRTRCQAYQGGLDQCALSAD